jgi:hypothetical protein
MHGKVNGAGTSMTADKPEADIDFELQGRHYTLTIRWNKRGEKLSKIEGNGS